MMPSARKRPPPEIAPSAYYDHANCPVRNVLATVGGKWSLLVLIHLSYGTHRFFQLRDALSDISQRMLTVTLRTLEREGLVHREVVPTTPPKVSYSLTDLGRSLLPAIKVLSEWAADHRGAVEAARVRFDQAHPDAPNQR